MNFFSLTPFLTAIASLLLLGCAETRTYQDSLRLSSDELNDFQRKVIHDNDGEAAWLLYLHYSTFPAKAFLADYWLIYAVELRYRKAIVFKESLSQSLKNESAE